MAEKVGTAGDMEVPTAGQLVDELLVFGPEPEEFDLSIGKVLVRPMKMGQIRKMIEVAGDLFPKVMMMAEEMKATGEISVSALGEIAGTKFMDLIGIAVNRKAVELDELDPDEFVKVVAKVMVVNMSFFGQTLPPILAAAKLAVAEAAAKNGVGGMLSKSSSVTDTDSKTSQSTPTTSS